MKRMLACVKTAKGPGNVEVKRIDIPKIIQGEVLTKVIIAGICGSDVKIYQDSHPYFPPVVLGHEIVGEIVSLSSGVENFQVGDIVATDLNANACGYCKWCRTGEEQICSHKKVPGYARDGGFAEYVSLPAKSLYKVPKNIVPEEAVFAEPLAVVVRGIIDRAQARPGDNVLVSGSGTLGLLAVQVLREIGANKIILTGLKKDVERLHMAKQLLGVDYTINVQDDDTLSVVKKVTDCGEGVDLVVELSGAKEAIIGSFKVVKRQGKILAIGIAKEQILVPWPKLVFMAPTIVFSVSSNYSSWSKALNLLARKKIKTEPLLTKKFALTQALEAIKEVEAGGIIKGVIVPGMTV